MNREDDVLRILLVEPLSLFRAALAAVLSYEDDFEVVAQLARVNETVMMARSVRPDVAIVDIDPLTDANLAIAAQLNEALPACAIVVLAGPAITKVMYEKLDRHVHGFFGKDTAPGRLAECVRQVAAGEHVVDPALAVAALSAPRSPLTAREREILREAASGRPSAEIATRVHLATGTVRNYLSTIMQKTGARNRLEAIYLAEEAGWL